MSGRLPSGLVASALIRRVHDAGGFAAVRARGDATGGGLLIIAAARDGSARLFERGLTATGASGPIESTPAGATPGIVEDYWRRRRARDPDLWVVELDIPDAERFAAETLGEH